MTSQTQSPNQPLHPPTADTPPFSQFDLAEPLLRGLTASGFERPTEIQAKALPAALEGRDLLASAQTGTGKTAAFVLPALQRLLQPSTRKGRGPRVLVLTPTRELAGQVEAVIRQLGRHTRLRSGTIVGGVSYGPQETLLRNPLDLLVATPGRLIDHMESGLVDTSRLELFVLDEADRMLDMGFIRPVQQIARALPTERQTMLFSATLEGAVTTVARTLLRDPVRIQLASAKVRHEAITQRMMMATGPEHKQALLTGLLEDPELTQAIVFTATKRGADRLAKRLNAGGHACAPLHGNMRQAARDRTVDSLRRGRVRILVATDVAARGIDLLGVSHVINFDLPTVAEDYIHRIGRTGRNGAFGTAISLVGPQDRVKLHSIERLTGYRLEAQELSWSEEDIRAAAAEYESAPQRNGRQRNGQQPAPQRPNGQRPGSRRRRRPERAAFSGRGQSERSQSGRGNAGNGGSAAAGSRRDNGAPRGKPAGDQGNAGRPAPAVVGTTSYSPGGRRRARAQGARSSWSG